MHNTLLLCYVLTCVVGVHASTFVCALGDGDAAHKKQAYSVRSGAYFLPVLASQPPGAQPRKAIVVVHGRFNSDQGLYFQNLVNHVQERGLEKDIVVVAPGFPDKPCNEKVWNGGSASLEALEWSQNTHQWTFGLNSDNKDGVSSFQALDDLVTWVEKEYAIKELVVTGFSAGGQMVLRWAIMSPHGADGTTSKGLPFRIVAGSPSTYEYLGAKRPEKSCSSDKSTGVDHTCAKFATPQPGSRRRATQLANSCNGTWDNYGYGLSGLQHARRDKDVDLANMRKYLKSTIKGAPQYADLLPQRFRTKDFRLAVGTKDEESCKAGECSDNCAAMVQGSNRLQRALNFKAHLQDALPGYAPKFGTFEAGHDFNMFFASPLFFDWAMQGSAGRLLGDAAQSAPFTDAIHV